MVSPPSIRADARRANPGTIMEKHGPPTHLISQNPERLRPCARSGTGGYRCQSAFPPECSKHKPGPASLPDPGTTGA